MREYFKPWRRKLGVVTLAMSCISLVVWISSFSNSLVCLVGGKQGSELNGISRAGFFRIQMPYHPGLEGRFQYNFSQEPDLFDDSDLEDNYEFLGFRTAQIKTADFDVQIISVVPHWSICVPLTLLTVWLLLSKRRQPTAENSTNPSDALS